MGNRALRGAGEGLSAHGTARVAGHWRDMRILLPMSVVLALSACATPSSRIAGALEAYGFSKSQSQCVGDRLQSRLSIAQLTELARLSRTAQARGIDPKTVSIGDLARLSGEIRDPRVTIEVAQAGASCGLLSSPIG